MRCPVCETDNPEDAGECATCGKQLMREADLDGADVAPIEGLEETIHDPLESVGPPAALLPELEQTQVARRDLQIHEERVPGVEFTALESDPDAPVLWQGGVDLDLGRAEDDGVRTLPPGDTATCPWCGVTGDGVVCDACGRRKTRYTQAATRAPAAAGRRDEDTVLCPACFARVAPGPRCVECGVPFAVIEL